MWPNVQSRLTGLLCLAILALLCSMAQAQIRVVPAATVEAKAHTADLIKTSLDLFLCVDGSSIYPCTNPVTDDTTYVPSITLTYGQVLDGAVAPTPRDLTTGVISLFRTGAVAPFCILMAGVSEPCPANSTTFDAGVYTLTGTLTFPAGSQYANSTSDPVVVTVLKDTSSIVVASSQNPSALGAPVTFTATVVGGYGEPATGQVIFTVDGGTTTSAALDGSGLARFTTSSLATGVHQIEASYAGSIDFLPAATDARYAETVLPPGTSTTLASSVDPSAFGQNVAFTANVTSAAAGVHPAGAVSFNDGTKTFATVLVSPQGVALTNISTLASGTHNITANYSGDAATGPSISPVLVQQVTYPLNPAGYGFTVTVTPSPVVLGTGLTANLTVAVTPKGGFSGPVTLTCGDLPHESTCTFGESVIPAGGGSTTLGLYVSSPHDCGSNSPYFYGANRPGPLALRYGGPLVAGLLMVLMPRRRRWRTGLLTFCACLALAGQSGCSSTCTDFGTYPGSYTFQVIGTAPAATTTGALAGSGTPLAVSTSVALTVKI